MSKPLRVGLIGYGYAGKTFHAPLIHATPALSLVAVASSRPADVIADWPDVAVKTDPAALITRPDIDLVVIATPNDTHAPLARAALAAGKHVVVDKPFTLDVAEAEALVDAAREAGRQLSVFHNRRWDADFLALRRLLADGVLGRVTEFQSRFDRYRPTVRQRWREGAGPGAGLWFDLGPHLVDQAVALFGVPQAVSANLAIRRDGGKAVDDALVVLHYPTLRAVLGASMLVSGGTPRFLVHGTLASFEKHGLDEQENQLKAGLTPAHADWGVDPIPGRLHRWVDDHPQSEAVPMPRGDYPAFYAAVAEAIHGRAPNPVPAEDAVAVMLVLEAAIRASDTNSLVRL
ncbi:oxidoreductase [Chitiniphilus shinanonensis]|uniref:Oxidoreductase n=1 Tax=Chitiniphilus shinanonensis TaxID=553088 RepID=A0ABQ6BSP4_9NEIS|nr:oxidoreductase [Chitiniphilus shinanonensis]GLS02898.1 oxidoreductase [Chitiniphilus shinanonensis]